MFQAFLALMDVSSFLDALKNLFNMIFNIILNDINFYDILPEVVIRNIRNLCVFIALSN